MVRRKGDYLPGSVHCRHHPPDQNSSRSYLLVVEVAFLEGGMVERYLLAVSFVPTKKTGKAPSPTTGEGLHEAPGDDEVTARSEESFRKNTRRA